MEAVVALILIYWGTRWAVTEGFKANRKAVTARRANTRATASQRGTSTQRVGSHRRAGRSAGMGYWLHALRHGFPVEREGLARGWRDHQAAAQAAQTDGSRERADHEDLLAHLRAQAAAHRHRMQVAAQQRQQSGHPNMSQQLAATPVTGAAGQPPPGNGKQPDPPLPDGKTAGAGPPTTNGQPQQQPGPATNNGGPVSGDTDFNYEASTKLADDLVTASDQVINEDMIGRATSMADGLASNIPDDSTTQGLAGDMAIAAQDLKAAAARLQDYATQLRDRLTTTYGPTHEDVQASGERAAQPEFHDA